MNLYKNIDRTKIQFDMVVHARKENDYVPLIESMGGHVYELPRLTRHPVSSLVQLYQLVKKNKYVAVIRHTPNALVSPQLLVSKWAGAHTICHSHSSTDLKMTAHRLGRLLMPFALSDRFACSEEAGKWMFGKKPYTIIHNAIDLELFSYSEAKVAKVEQEFSLQKSRLVNDSTSQEGRADGTLIFGYIANLIPSKNHVFLIDIFKELVKLHPDSVLFCLGEGVAKPQIEQKIKDYHLEDKVYLTGMRYDPENFLSAFHTLIFPSIYEGLPLSLIEAQASGIPILMSDTITDDVIVTQGLVEKLALQASPEFWASKALQKATHPEVSRDCQKEAITKAGYNIRELSDWFTQYINHISRQ